MTQAEPFCRCKTCGGLILWARLSSGALVKVDRKPADDGSLTLTLAEHSIIHQARVSKEGRHKLHACKNLEAAGVSA